MGINLLDNKNIKLDVILLLDDISKKKIRSSLADFDMSGITIVSDFIEITDELLSNTRKVIILEDYLSTDNARHTMKIMKELLSLEYIYIGINEINLSYMKNIAECYPMSIDLLDYNQIYSIIMKDSAVMSDYLVNPDTVDDKFIVLSDKILLDSKHSEDIKDLAEDYKRLASIVKEQSKSISEYNDRYSKLERERDFESNLNKELSKFCFNTVKNISIHNRQLDDYNIIFSKDVYDKFILSEYKDKPIVIYLKEYTELQYFNTFLDTLFKMIRYKFHISCKILKLYDRSGSKKLCQQPSEAKVIANNFKLSDIESNDYIVKFGDYTSVLDIMLSNKVKTDVLILVDCKDHLDTVTLGHELEYNLCSNKADFKLWDLDERNTITNSVNSMLSWSYYSEYNIFDTEEDLINFLCNRVIMQFLYNDLEKRIGDY